MSKIFPKLFFQNFFLQILFPTFFFQYFFSKIFFSFFSNIFFSKFFSQHFFPQICFQFFFQNFFFEGFTLNASLFTETKRTACICVMKNMIYSKRRNWTLVSCDKVLFFGSYCSHHTRREKFNSFPATHNIVYYYIFFRNLLYSIEVLKCFLDGI